MDGNLRHIGGFQDFAIEKVMGMDDPWRYRNKAQFPFGKDKDGNIVTGFYAGRTRHHSQQELLSGVEENEKILDMIISYMEEIMWSRTMRRQERESSAMH